jgi:2-phosphosulfolactate phosphatase
LSEPVTHWDQQNYRIRFDWGLRGALECGPGSTVVAVVDVLSFTTTVTVAADLGVEILPYRWRDDTAAAYAERNDAALAVGRSQAGPGRVSLSPVTFRTTPGLRRVVLPSPNGSTVAEALTGLGCEVVAVSLRNARAAADWARERAGDDGTVLAVAAGEHWAPAGELRPAVEDLWGAGAFLAALTGDASPEARAAVAAYESMREPLAALSGCASGRELIEQGYAADVEVAAEQDRSRVVPVLRDGVFQARTT